MQCLTFLYEVAFSFNPAFQCVEKVGSALWSWVNMRLGETATCVFFGVFDGHGGPYCAEHVVQVSVFEVFEVAPRDTWRRRGQSVLRFFVGRRKSTHLAKNVLARLRDRAQNVSDEAESSRKKHVVKRNNQSRFGFPKSKRNQKICYCM